MSLQVIHGLSEHFGRIEFVAVILVFGNVVEVFRSGHDMLDCKSDSLSRRQDLADQRAKNGRLFNRGSHPGTRNKTDELGIV